MIIHHGFFKIDMQNIAGLLEQVRVRFNCGKDRVVLIGLALIFVVCGQSWAQEMNDQVDLYYFWSRYCPHCQEAKPFIQQLDEKYAWLTVHSFDLIGHQQNQKLFQNMAQQAGQPANSVPAFIFCNEMVTGYDHAKTTGRVLEKKLLDCFHKIEGKTQESFLIPGLGELHYQDFSLPVFTLIIATLDAFNPCAFFILFFLLSLLVNQKSRSRMLVIGSIFVLCSGVMYFLFMSAWLNLFLITDKLFFITLAAGFIAVMFGALNIKDFFFFNQGVSLSLSEDSKHKLFTRIRNLAQNGSWFSLIGATIVLATAANSYELLCTAGLPMVFTRVLTLYELDTMQYYFYLALYNAVYVLPLLAIVVVFTFTLGKKKLSTDEGRLLKLLSGSMMLGLGAILLINPQWLNNLWVSLIIIGSAVLLTLLAWGWQKIRGVW